MKYLDLFFEEKEIPYISWELQDSTGTPHFIDNEYIIETVKVAPKHEQEKIADVLRKIDFHNGDVNDFLKHLAQGLVNNYAGGF